MPPEDLIVTDAGRIALELLAQNHVLSVIGLTSQGAFQHTPTGWVIYLTGAARRGPLTLNIAGKPDWLSKLQAGDTAAVTTDCIEFSPPGFTIHFGQASIWQAPALPPSILPASRRIEQLRAVAGYLTGGKQGRSTSDLLTELLGFNETGRIHQPGELSLRLEQLQGALRQGQVAEIARAAGEFLGMGSGLTPAGDDLIVGLLLTLNRWGSRVCPKINAEALNQALLPPAIQKTTALSASLIHCAAQSEANERLILALDGILTGEPEPRLCAELLQGWGSTSGGATLAGMLLAIESAR